MEIKLFLFLFWQIRMTLFNFYFSLCFEFVCNYCFQCFLVNSDQINSNTSDGGSLASENTASSLSSHAFHRSLEPNTEKLKLEQVNYEMQCQMQEIEKENERLKAVLSKKSKEISGLRGQVI